MSTKLYYTGIDLQQNELQNAVIHPLTSAPSNPIEGQIYYNSNDNKLYIYNGASWESATSSQLTVEDGGIGTTQLANDSVTKDKINADVVGEGLIQNVNGAIDVNVDNSTLEIVNDIVKVKDDGITQAKLDSTLEGKIVNAKKQLFGDGTATTFTFTHNMNSSDLFCHTWKDIGNGKWQEVECQITIDSDNQVTIGAFPAPATNSLKVILQRAILS